jgi:hypothetical protein
VRCPNTLRNKEESCLEKWRWRTLRKRQRVMRQGIILAIVKTSPAPLFKNELNNHWNYPWACWGRTLAIIETSLVAHTRGRGFDDGWGPSPWARWSSPKRSSLKLTGAITLLNICPSSLELLKLNTCNIKIKYKAWNCGKGEELTSWLTTMCDGETSTWKWTRITYYILWNPNNYFLQEMKSK